MIYGSICSGIEAATVAWEPLGWQAAWFAETEPFPSAVLAHHWPDVPNLGDFTKIGADHGPVDLLVGGTPCQSFSVAGKRAGLDDPRGNLTLEYLALADRLRPRWLVWENVPGVLSDDSGRTFGTILGTLAELGYGFAYRVLDAQYFGIPQRRRRVFLIGYLGDWRPAGAVLFERQSLSGDTETGRKTGQGVAAPFRSRVDSGGKGGYAGRGGEDDYNLVAALSANGVGTCGADDNQAQGGHLVFDTTQITSKENRSNPKPGDPCHPLAAKAHPPAVFSESGPGWWRDGVGTLRERSHLDATDGIVCFQPNDPGPHLNGDVSPTLRTPINGGGHGSLSAIAYASQVRRLTPIECERLQGFPDNHTRIRWRGKKAKKCPDGPRYRAIGNSMAVPVMRWIGERIGMVDRIQADATLLSRYA